MIQIESAQSPFTFPRVAFQAITAIGRADAMGLLPQDERIERLDLPSFHKVFRYIQRAGIGRTLQFDMEEHSADLGVGMERTLKHLNRALEESPSPEFEWNRMIEVLGLDFLSQLLGI